MTSGNRAIRPRRAATLLLALAIPATGSCAGLDLDALLARLARPGPAQTRFVEVRDSALLAAPLVTSGTLEYRSASALSKSTETPHRELVTIAGEDVRVERQGKPARRFSLKRAPELRGVLASFAALLAGDRKALERYFTLEGEQAGAYWTLRLTPREARVRKRIASVEFVGADAALRCFVVAEPDGDASVTLLDALAAAPLPQPPAREALLKLCRTGTP